MTTAERIVHIDYDCGCKVGRYFPGGGFVLQCVDHADEDCYVNPSDPATIERAARAIHAKDCGCSDYNNASSVENGDYYELALAALASLTSTGQD